MKRSTWLLQGFTAALTLAILAALVYSVDVSALSDEIAKIDLPRLILALLFLALPFIVNGVRYKLMVREHVTISYAESVRLFFVCQSLNVVTPSKLGDLAKVFFLRSERFPLRTGTAAALFEKIIDLFGIMVFASVGILFLTVDRGWAVAVSASLAVAVVALIILFSLDFRQGGLGERIVSFFLGWRRLARLRTLALDMLGYFQDLRKNPANVLLIFLTTLLAWFLHLVQGSLLFRAIGAPVGFFAAIGLIPFGILAGMLPITIAGIGTRETAFIVAFAPYAAPATLLLFGLLFSFRYVVSAAVGLLWLPHYTAKETKKFGRWIGERGTQQKRP
ncbi:flippase-like domain-containing protein [Candidatus Woesearchaeota archaeon]|nr:flippase-like domain-containing protein [Candidatus Woesearchaeota archaeon]